MDRTNERAYIIETDAFEPAIGMPVDDRSAGAVSDHILDDTLRILPAGGSLVALGSVHFAAALDVEVQRIAVAPPEPIEAAGFDREV